MSFASPQRRIVETLCTNQLSSPLHLGRTTNVWNIRHHWAECSTTESHSGSGLLLPSVADRLLKVTVLHGMGSGPMNSYNFRAEVSGKSRHKNGAYVASCEILMS